MGLQEPSWIHDPEPTQEILEFSFDFHTEEGIRIWISVKAMITMSGNSADIECSYNLQSPWLPYWNEKYIDPQILEDQLRDHFSEIYTEFEIEFNRI